MEEELTCVNYRDVTLADFPGQRLVRHWGKVQVLTSRLLRNSHGLIVAHGAVLVRLMNPLIVCDRYRFGRLGLRISFPITQDLVRFAIAILGHLRSALFEGFAVVV